MLRPFETAERNAVYDPQGIADVFVRRLISTKFVAVVKDGQSAAAPIPIAYIAAAPSAPEFRCDVAGCDKTYNTKLKLASHGKAHKD